jgi:hypothetical protein
MNTHPDSLLLRYRPKNHEPILLGHFFLQQESAHSVAGPKPVTTPVVNHVDYYGYGRPNY